MYTALPNHLLQTPMAPPGGHSKRIPPPWPAAGCPAALVSKATALLLLICTLDSGSGFAPDTFSSSARQQLRRYRPSCDPSFGRRRGGAPLFAGPSSSSPTPPKRPSAAKKKGTSSVKFAGGRVTRPVQQPEGNKDDEEEDVRKKSARWGVKPPSPPKLPSIPDVRSLKNPLDGVGKSLRKVTDEYGTCACGAIT